MSSYQPLFVDRLRNQLDEAHGELDQLKAQLSAVTRERDEAVNQLKAVNGCLDWGAIASGRATTLSEVQRTISVLRETQHGRDQDRIKHEMERDQLRSELATLRNGWISVTERLPEDDGCESIMVWVTGVYDGKPFTDIALAEGNRFLDPSDEDVYFVNVTHWTYIREPIPAPPADGRAE